MKAFLAMGFVAVALFSQGCFFGGGGDPEPTATNVPPTATATPSVADDTSTPTDATPTTGEDTATPDPAAPREYTVKPGDFLGVIAAEYGITVEALAAANGIDDPNKIFVGQVLIIPPAQ